MAVSHSVTITVPRQEITYNCVSWDECVNGAWVHRKERREAGRKDLPDLRFNRQGKLGTRDVTQLLAQAKSAFERLARNDDKIADFCQ